MQILKWVYRWRLSVLLKGIGQGRWGKEVNLQNWQMWKISLELLSNWQHTELKSAHEQQKYGSKCSQSCRSFYCSIPSLPHTGIRSFILCNYLPQTPHLSSQVHCYPQISGTEICEWVTWRRLWCMWCYSELNFAWLLLSFIVVLFNTLIKENLREEGTLKCKQTFNSDFL